MMAACPRSLLFVALACALAAAMAAGAGDDVDASATGGGAPAAGPYVAPAFGGAASFLETFQGEGGANAFVLSKHGDYTGQVWEVTDAEGIVGIPGDKVFATQHDAQRCVRACPAARCRVAAS